MTIVLSQVEARVLGSLVEKEITTPEYYPLSLTRWRMPATRKITASR